jgi:hypothetical protein
MNTQIEEFDMNENLEILQIIEEWKLDFHLGNAVKHILSSGKKETKDEELQDLKRASWYLTRKIQVLNDETQRLSFLFVLNLRIDIIMPKVCLDF